jgi:hypothetical protein
LGFKEVDSNKLGARQVGILELSGGLNRIAVYFQLS